MQLDELPFDSLPSLLPPEFTYNPKLVIEPSNMAEHVHVGRSQIGVLSPVTLSPIDEETRVSIGLADSQQEPEPAPTDFLALNREFSGK